MNKKTAVLIAFQLFLVTACGIASKDIWYAIVVSIIGVVFNFLVSLGNPLGFWFGLAYAVTNGALAFQTGTYASFAFMFFLQAPMAVYSFFSWRKKEQVNEAVMKKMSAKQVALLISIMLLLGFVMFFVLTKLHSNAVLADDVFFVFSVSACILLAFGYKNAYIVTLLSGLGGTVLWGYQMIHTGSGLSIAVFYVIVSINSIIAIYRQYFKQKQYASMLL